MVKQVPAIESELERLKQQMITQEAFASIGAMVPGVTHEVNTPLGVCITSLSFLRNELTDLQQVYKAGELTEHRLNSFMETCDEVSRLLEKNLNRAAQLIHSFKAIATNQSLVECSPFKLDELLNDVIASLRHETKRCVESIRITGADQIELFSDAGALTQVFNNLVMNTVHHGFNHSGATDIQGIIEINCTQSDDQITIFYRDNGQGVAADNQDKIFEPFFTTRRGNGGTGLGLSIIKELMQQRLHGSIEYQPQDVGAGFLLKLPKVIA